MMFDGDAAVQFTEKKVAGALPYAINAICDIRKYNKATFENAYDIERKEKFNIDLDKKEKEEDVVVFDENNTDE